MKLLTERQAAEVLQVNRSTLQRWRLANEAPRHTVLNGKAIRYEFAEIEAWVNAQANDNNTKEEK